MTTFDVETSVDLGPKLRPNKEGFAPAWRTQGIIEALEPYDDSVTLVQTFSERNMLAEACTMAFFKHYPLVLSPDVIWLAIMQGFAKHVDANAEKLRSQFVDFEGKKELIVRRDNFVKGSPDNDWAGVFPEFCSQIGSFVGEPLVQTMEADFTTTTPGSKVASQITIMDTVKHYFKYTMMCGCGIPSITLKGTAEDWIKVREKAIQLKRFDLDWWLSELLPVLDQFVAAAEGKADRDFWRSVVNVHGGSGMVTGPMTGWMQVCRMHTYVCVLVTRGGVCKGNVRVRVCVCACVRVHVSVSVSVCVSVCVCILTSQDDIQTSAAFIPFQFFVAVPIRCSSPTSTTRARATHGLWARTRSRIEPRSTSPTGRGASAME
eukprot:TRINITY_DN11492_c6_g3_i3.p1 TRINITY_DN11492_c6_g3~~TRINITY_DN11492_c6_g3_i3.p1  ORF type:complete len:376 (+),score=74.18 TRINITY_DN11492_c6_g3_i3:67-1194(+)